ncbi:MAG: hypothetical protein E7G82_07765, partial [Veillonella sp.]|nr:hypothetical protein [Veillonella sp.]
MKGRVDRHDQRLDYLQDNIVDNSTRITAVEDSVKANTTNIANNTTAIDKNTKAIEALNGKVGTTITNIESTINNKIE